MEKFKLSFWNTIFDIGLLIGWFGIPFYIVAELVFEFGDFLQDKATRELQKLNG